jgi:hypothetical protein
LLSHPIDNALAGTVPSVDATPSDQAEATPSDGSIAGVKRKRDKPDPPKKPDSSKKSGHVLKKATLTASMDEPVDLRTVAVMNNYYRDHVSTGIDKHKVPEDDFLEIDLDKGQQEYPSTE